ncbi:GNAT family N-acetyltransferase [Salinimicrobium xinjiangense]|uniref:GNAT family N-acetyltransferase n=1 Tax=Salinimicrobium xinjiangense TaxID=438596 RepID=UPI000423AA0E|nr:GNAT family N-acetyltransferase [Salinimicrobium xinjiangense]
MIRPAQLEDLASIKKLTEACAQSMQEKGIFQWNEYYPSLEKLQEDISNEELFVLEEKAQLQGIIVLTPNMDKEYISVDWLTPNKNNLYVHRLATNPRNWGSGKGRKLMDFAENFAREKGYSSVRLDTFSQNERNQKFYEVRGYKRLGNIYFPKQSEHPFYCYELVLD